VSLLPGVIHLLGDSDDGVRASAIWALGRISPDEFDEMKTLLAENEGSSVVRTEWDFSAGENELW
jgi:HEAT repeat protein